MPKYIRPLYSSQINSALKNLSETDYAVYRYLLFKLAGRTIPFRIPLFLFQKALSLSKMKLWYRIQKLKKLGLLEVFSARHPKEVDSVVWTTENYYRLPRFMRSIIPQQFT